MPTMIRMERVAHRQIASIDWSLIALGVLVIALIAAEAAVILHAVPAFDPLTAITVT